jgi:hypothetical protein
MILAFGLNFENQEEQRNAAAAGRNQQMINRRQGDDNGKLVGIPRSQS